MTNRVTRWLNLSEIIDHTQYGNNVTTIKWTQHEICRLKSGGIDSCIKFNPDKTKVAIFRT